MKTKVKVTATVAITVEVDVDDIHDENELLDAAQDELEGLLLTADFESSVIEIKKSHNKKF